MHPDLVILYVDSPAASAAFYADVLGLEPVESSPTFAMFALPVGPTAWPVVASHC